MARQRVEDLGRLMVMLNVALDDEIFSNCRHEDDFVTHYFPASIVRESENDVYIDRLSQLHTSISVLKDRLYDALTVAMGHDELNDEEL